MTVWMGGSRGGGGITLWVCVLLLGATLMLSGCGLWRRVTDGTEPSTDPTQQSEETAPPEQEPAAESSEPAEDVADTPTSEEESPEDSTPTEVTEEAAAEEKEAGPEPPSDSQPTETGESPDLSDAEGFVVDLPPEERAALQTQIQSDLTTAMEVLDAWVAVERVSPERAEQLQTIQDFVELSRAAVDEEDLLGASNLALKARILAEEIGRP